MHRFSIIVPMQGDQRLFDDTLASVLRYRADNCQIIVVHGGNYADQYGLEDEVKFVAADRFSNNQRTGKQLLSHFLDCGVQNSNGKLIACLRPGIELAEGWDKPIVEAFEDKKVGSVSPIIVTPDNPDTIVVAGVKSSTGFRRKLVGSGSKISPRSLKRVDSIGPASWAAFYRASAILQVGDLNSQLDDLYVDLDTALSLKTLGYRHVLSDKCIAYVENATTIEFESTQPHGTSAQRASLRHQPHSVTSSPWLGSITTFVSEVVASPLQRWKFRHAMQRLAARRMFGVDVQFASRLEELAETLKRIDETGLGVVDTRSTQSVVLTQRGERRAA